MYKENKLIEGCSALINEVTNSSIMVREHWHNYYELLYIIEGEITQTFDNRISLFKENDILLIAPKTVHSTFSNSEFCKIIVVLFDEDFFTLKKSNDFFFFGKENLFKAELLSLFQKIHTEYENKKLSYLQMIQGCLLEIFAYLDRVKKDIEPQTSRDYPQIREIFSFIDNHIYEKISLSYTAKALGYTPEYLTFMVKQYSGYSFKPYVDNAKIIIAIRLLIFEKMSIKEVSHKLSFEDVSTFSRTFKRIMGKSPKKYLVDQTS